MVSIPAVKQQRQGSRRALILTVLALCVLGLGWAHVTALRASSRSALDFSASHPRHTRLLADTARSVDPGAGATVTQGVVLGELGQYALAQQQAADAEREKLPEQPQGFVPGAVWKVPLRGVHGGTSDCLCVLRIKDVDGRPIQAHGGSVLEHEGVWYWYGEHKGGTTYFSHTIGYSTPRVDFIGISCYSSKDLLNWRFEGLALRSGQHAELAPDRVAERPRVLYNRASRTFVMWCHVDEADYELARVGIAVSSRPQGPYEYQGSYRPHGQQARDLTVFQDDDGTAYVAYSSENNMVMHIACLKPDYLAPEPDYHRVMVDRKREAPAVFKHAGQYFMLTSGCQGWDASAMEAFVASNMLGEWRSLGNPCTGASQLERLLTYFAQATHVIPYRKHPGSFILMADRWAPDDLGSSRYVWLPMWAMELSHVQQVEAAQRLKGVGALSGTARTAQLPARIPVAGVDVVVRWMNSWTLEDLAANATSRFVMP